MLVNLGFIAIYLSKLQKKFPQSISKHGPVDDLPLSWYINDLKSFWYALKSPVLMKKHVARAGGKRYSDLVTKELKKLVSIIHSFSLLSYLYPNLTN